MCKGRFRDMADTMNDEFAIAAREEGAVEWPPVDHQDAKAWMRGLVRVLQKPPSEVDAILADRGSYIDTLPKAEAKLYLAEVDDVNRQQRERHTSSAPELGLDDACDLFDTISVLAQGTVDDGGDDPDDFDEDMDDSTDDTEKKTSGESVTTMKRRLREKRVTDAADAKHARQTKKRTKEAIAVLHGSNGCGYNESQDAKGIEGHLESLQKPLDDAMRQYRALLSNALSGSLFQACLSFTPQPKAPLSLFCVDGAHVEAELLQISTEHGIEQIVRMPALVDNLVKCSQAALLAWNIKFNKMLSNKWSAQLPSTKLPPAPTKGFTFELGTPVTFNEPVVAPSEVVRAGIRCVSAGPGQVLDAEPPELVQGNLEEAWTALFTSNLTLQLSQNLKGKGGEPKSNYEVSAGVSTSPEAMQLSQDILSTLAKRLAEQWYQLIMTSAKGVTPFEEFSQLVSHTVSWALLYEYQYSAQAPGLWGDITQTQAAQVLVSIEPVQEKHLHALVEKGATYSDLQLKQHHKKKADDGSGEIWSDSQGDAHASWGSLNASHKVNAAVMDQLVASENMDTKQLQEQVLQALAVFASPPVQVDQPESKVGVEDIELHTIGENKQNCSNMAMSQRFALANAVGLFTQDAMFATVFTEQVSNPTFTADISEVGPEDLLIREPDLEFNLFTAASFNLPTPGQEACVNAQFLCGGRDANEGLEVKNDAAGGGYRYCSA